MNEYIRQRQNIKLYRFVSIIIGHLDKWQKHFGLQRASIIIKDE